MADPDRLTYRNNLRGFAIERETQMRERELQVQEDYDLALKLWKEEHDNYMASLGLGRELEEDQSGSNDSDSESEDGNDNGINSTIGVGSNNDKSESRSDAEGHSTQAVARCCACGDMAPMEDTKILDGEPEHTFCRGCLIEFVKTSISDSTLFPPRCCNIPVAVESCGSLLPEDLIDKFIQKREELSTPNPTYCVSCGQFITLANIRSEAASCASCGEVTCASCKEAAHDGLCQEDPNVRLLMDLANRSQWQRCQKCNTMVERDTGCFHITYEIESVLNNGTMANTYFQVSLLP